MLGEALQSQKKYADAEPHLLRGYEGLKQCEAKIPKDQSAVLTQALERLIQLYSAWQNKGDRAAEWQQRLDAHNETIKKAMKPKDK